MDNDSRVTEAAANLTVAALPGVNSMSTIAESSFSFERTPATGRGGAVAGKMAVAALEHLVLHWHHSCNPFLQGFHEEDAS